MIVFAEAGPVVPWGLVSGMNWGSWLGEEVLNVDLKEEEKKGRRRGESDGRVERGLKLLDILSGSCFIGGSSLLLLHSL